VQSAESFSIEHEDGKAEHVPRGLPAEFATRAAQSRAEGPYPERSEWVDGASTSRTMPAVAPGDGNQEESGWPVDWTER
jgi:hypothetical protein